MDGKHGKLHPNHGETSHQVHLNLTQIGKIIIKLFHKILTNIPSKTIIIRSKTTTNTSSQVMTTRNKVMIIQTLVMNTLDPIISTHN